MSQLPTADDVSVSSSSDVEKPVPMSKEDYKLDELIRKRDELIRKLDEVDELIREQDELNYELVRLKKAANVAQHMIACANQLIMTYECDANQEDWRNGNLVLWHYKGRHYLRNKENHLRLQKTRVWAGIYVEDEDRIDETATEPEYEDEPPPLVSLRHVEWQCDKTQGCLCK